MPSPKVPQPVLAAIIGVGGIALIIVVFQLLGDLVPATIPALLLLIPVTATAMLTNWKVATPVAILAALTYAFLFLEPVGTVSIGFTQDVFILITFVAVSLSVSLLVSHRSTRHRATSIDEDRMQLLRSVSHDLRSPLSTIRAVSSDLLDGTDYDDSTRTALLSVVLDESERLDRIVGNLLSLGRVQAGAFAPTLHVESITNLIHCAVTRLGRLGANTVVYSIDSSMPDVRADPVQIDQVLANLIENAVRHSPPGTTVSIGATLVGEHVVVDVDDCGPGFSESARDTAFEVFHSEDGSSGLGLSVCKAIVEAHGGIITIGENPTGGARVSFTLEVAS